MPDRKPPPLLEFYVLQNAVRGRDRKALGAVNLRVHRVVAALLGRKDPQEVGDVTQRGMVQVLEGFRSLPNHPPNHNIAPWINTVARNEVFMHLRHNKHYEQVFCDNEKEVEAEHHDPYDPVNLEDTANAKILLAAQQSLPPEYRVPLVLGRFEGYSLKEIAHELGIQVGTVKSRLNRAEQLLREYVAASDPTYSNLHRTTPNVTRKRVGS